MRRACTCACVRVCARAGVCARAHTVVRGAIDAQLRAHTHTCAHARAHTHTRAHVSLCARSVMGRHRGRARAATTTDGILAHMKITMDVKFSKVCTNKNALAHAAKEGTWVSFRTRIQCLTQKYVQLSKRLRSSLSACACWLKRWARDVVGTHRRPSVAWRSGGGAHEQSWRTTIRVASSRRHA